MALSANDKKWIKNTVEKSVLSGVAISKAHTDEKLTQFEEKFNGLPEKADEILDRMDKSLGEIQRLREDFNLLLGRVGDHEERIAELESVKLSKIESTT